jgi:hypothetical protein
MILSCGLEARRDGRKGVPQGLKALIHLAQDGTAKQAAEKVVFRVGRAFIPGLEFLHFRAANWPTEDIFPYSDQRTA